MPRKRKSNNPAGRPVTVGGTEAVRVLSVTFPRTLREQVEASATGQGISVSEWMRRAARSGLAPK